MTWDVPIFRRRYFCSRYGRYGSVGSRNSIKAEISSLAEFYMFQLSADLTLRLFSLLIDCLYSVLLIHCGVTQIFLATGYTMGIVDLHYALEALGFKM